jgi:type IV pilus assembly protein PilE
MNKQLGVSLLELMIVIVIIGIVASIAYPSYVDNVQDTRRAECSGALVGLGNAMERFYSVNGTYLGAAAGGANTGAPAVFATSCPVDGGNVTYNLTIQAATASTYALLATPVGPQAADECGSLTMTNRGLKGVVGADAGLTWDDCW